MPRSLPSRLLRALGSILNPRSYFHILHLIHYYGYSHVNEIGKLRTGAGTHVPPNASLRNAERIEIGKCCSIGDHSYLWAGNSSGRIIIGDNLLMAPGVFITASNYQFKANALIRDQPKRERDVVIGNDVWLGTHVIITAGVTIGDGCIVGAGAVVTKDIPPGSIAAGIPAKVISMRKND